jgi:hypothetical protein
MAFMMVDRRILVSVRMEWSLCLINRAALIEVKAHSINYWYSKGKLATVTEMVKGAITGETAAPGSLRFLSEQDVEEARKASR